mmetsp:Transcript_26827/g.57045  ORF Transcript_26827/g.57045 Transcript_26827/m.57045 type:complete len:309 (-) Transcript_26827:201-1127(-)
MWVCSTFLSKLGQRLVDTYAKRISSIKLIQERIHPCKMTWTCGKCTFINDESSDEDEKCMVCQEPRKNSTGSIAASRGMSRTDFNQSMRISDLSKDGAPARGDSIAALGNMSFAAWESDRKAWTCKACTFTNEPRFLMCGACGMAEGSSAVEDELIKLGLQKMSLHSAHEFLIKTVHKQLDSDREDQLRRDRAVELLRDHIKEECAYEEAENAEADDQNQKESLAFAKAREHIGTLERIQQAEREEHQNMLFTIEQWRVTLREEPNDEQEREMERQEALLDHLLKEWEDREKELRRVRLRLDGNLASI